MPHAASNAMSTMLSGPDIATPETKLQTLIARESAEGYPGTNFLGDIPIYVINLDRSPARLAHAREQLGSQGLSFTRIPAVDARDLDEAALAAVFDARRSRRSYYAPMHKGEIACFLSHRLAWKTFLSTSDAPFAVILEDDFAFRGQLSPIIAALLGNATPRWDMIKLWSRKKGAVAVVAPLSGHHRLIRHRVLPTLTIGQIVTRAAAEKLLLGAMPIYRPLDVQIQFWWEIDLDVLSIDPPLVADASGDLGGSDLQGSARRSLADKLRRELGRPIFRLILLAQSTFHDRRRCAPKET